MPVTRAVIDAMIATGCPEAQAAGLAEGLHFTRILDVNAIVGYFPHMQFYYAMTVPREFRASFIRWHNANCTPDMVWELAPDEGTWDDVDWVEFEEGYKETTIAYVYELAASQSAA